MIRPSREVQRCWTTRQVSDGGVIAQFFGRQKVYDLAKGFDFVSMAELEKGLGSIKLTRAASRPG